MPNIYPALMMVPSLCQSWIPSLDRMLPGIWADPNLISTKAAKADDALVEFSMWDQLVSLILPCSSHHLDFIRCAFMGFQIRFINHQFCQFVITIYDDDWL
jgi:hypothetical protein